MNGFVMLYRSLLDHPLWQKKPFAEGQAWVDMIMLASWNSGRAKGGFTVRRGEFVMSIVILSKRWGWSRAKVSRFLNKLESEHQIRKRSNNVSTLISLRNYEKYHPLPSEKRAARGKTEHPRERGNLLIKNEKTDADAGRSSTYKEETTAFRGIE